MPRRPLYHVYRKKIRQTPDPFNGTIWHDEFGGEGHGERRPSPIFWGMGLA
jgi:hypothetical protein